MDLTFNDVHVAIHDMFCSCGEPGDLRGEACTEHEQQRITDSLIAVLLKRGALHEVTVNDDGGCTHTLSGCCWICGEVGDHGGVPHDRATGDRHTRYDIIDYLDGRRFRGQAMV